MGNVLSRKPNQFSFDDPTRVMEGRYLQTYRQRPITRMDPDDSLALGGGRVQLGVKVLQSMNTGQFYVTDPAGQPIVLSGGNPPQFFRDAAERIQRGANYGRGPAVFISGSPLGPKVTMFASSDMTASRKYQPIRINNMRDFEFAMESGHAHQDYENEYAGYRGQAAINPFLLRGNDFESTMADVGRFVVDTTMRAWASVPEMIMDEVLPFSGTILGGITGASDALQQGAQAVATSITTPAVTEANYVSGDYDPNMANLITDPRLGSYFRAIQAQNESQPGAMNFSNFPQETAQQQITKGRLLSKENQELYLREQTKRVADSMIAANSVFQNSQNANLRELTAGLRNAPDNAAKLNVIRFFQNRLKQDVLPRVSVGSDLYAQLNQDITGIVDIDPISRHLADLTNNPLSINGDFIPPQHTSTIQG